MIEPITLGDATLYIGDALEVLASLPDGCVQTCVTSPPYWGLRDYGTAKWEGGDSECDHKSSGTNRGKRDELPNPPAGWAERSEYNPYRDTCGKCGATRIDQQLGLERTPEEYVAKLVAIFREVRRVLRDDGTIWVNLGDSYATNQAGNTTWGDGVGSNKHYQNGDTGLPDRIIPTGLKPKDLVGIPWRIAFALQADGWYLRSDIIWAKPNPMPESVTDRPTKAHEYVFLLSKSQRYYYDQEAVREGLAESTIDDKRNGSGRHTQGDREGSKYFDNDGIVGAPPELPSWYRGKVFVNPSAGRNRRTVWTIATQPYPESHFATYPEKLVEPCILAGTSERGCCPECGKAWVRVVEKESRPANEDRIKDLMDKGVRSRQSANLYTEHHPNPSITTGWKPACNCDSTMPNVEIDEDIEYEPTPYPPIPCIVLDPFTGSGTTGAVALKHGRRFIGVELKPEYMKLAKKRIGEHAKQMRLTL